MFGKTERPTPAEVEKAAAEAAKQTGDTRGPGRPEKENGTKDRKRTSITIYPDLIDRLKILAVKKGSHVYLLMEDAIEQYLKENGQ